VELPKPLGASAVVQPDRQIRDNIKFIRINDLLSRMCAGCICPITFLLLR
jgi:hypothetical protein